MAKALAMKIQEGAVVRDMTAAEIAAAVSPPEPSPPRSAASFEVEARALIAAAFGAHRHSVASYYTRLRGLAPDSMTGEQRADLATLDEADDWESAMLEYARGPALTAPSLVWPTQPDGLAELVAAC